MTYFVLSVDDAATKDFSSCADLSCLLEFLKKYGVHSTIFVVPQDGGVSLCDKKEWVEVFRRASDEGHDLQLHGYEHGPFEFGIPPDFILAYEHEVRKKLETKREEIEQNLTVPKIEERLNRGLEIFEKALGFRPGGFRSPYASIHKNLFAALGNCGFLFDSSIAINPKGWHYIRKDYETKAGWFNIEPRPFRLSSGILEVPLMTEYTWYLKKGDGKRQLNLLKEDIDICCDRADGSVLVAVAHVSPMHDEALVGYGVYRQAISYAREKGMKIATIKEVLEKENR